MENIMRFRHNVMNVNSISAFEGIRGGINQNCKDIYFVRLVGVNDTLLSDIRQMDSDMAERMASGQVIYQRILRLPGFDSPKAAFYENCYHDWIAQQKRVIASDILKGNIEYGRLLASGIQKAAEIYFTGKPMNSSIEKNFVIKMLFWHDFLLADVIKEWNGRLSVKLVLSNAIKQQEYLFCYLLTLLGYDVLLLQSEADISEKEEALGLSQKIQIGSFRKIDLPDFCRTRVETPASKPVSIERPVPAAKPISARKAAPGEEICREKSFEELALLASSVVLIAIHDKNGDVIGTGSGIMIGENGYILTNNHVASGGRFYSIRIEDDETVYSTDELIKYHSVLDLAVLRIERKLNPLPIYQGNGKLVRGQKVVAIGSPLGLFNSVSDGIISGFRKIDGVDMIQFTAPTSHGSSGGAVLNMYGEVIGISTAGFDNAQNINLAMGYECINQFIRGFLSPA